MGGTYALFVFRGRPEEYNLPSVPEVPTVHLKPAWGAAAVAAGLMTAGAVLAFLSGSAPDDRQDRTAARQPSPARSRR